MTVLALRHSRRANAVSALHGEVSRAYGVFNEQLGAANRATFVIGKDGKIADVIESPNLATPREKAAYDAALGRL